MAIRYDIILESLEYYKTNGFKYVDVEWSVPQQIVDITLPHRSGYFFLKDKCLVGSAEQSFLHMIINESLEPDRYVACSPCFRDEILDDLHKQYFFKTELIDFKTVTEGSLIDIIHLCKRFFEKKLSDVEIVQLGEFEYDLEYQGIELGSYGIRHHQDLSWIYATGVAEPRFSDRFPIYNP